MLKIIQQLLNIIFQITFVIIVSIRYTFIIGIIIDSNTIVDEEYIINKASNVEDIPLDMMWDNKKNPLDICTIWINCNGIWEAYFTPPQSWTSVKDRDVGIKAEIPKLLRRSVMNQSWK